MKGKTIFVTAMRDAGLIAAGAVLGLIALLLVHLLPTDPMREHVYWSLEMIEKEFEDEILVEGYTATLTGSFTDCLMLEHAIYESEEHGVLEQTLKMYRSESCAEQDGWEPGRSLKDYLERIPQAQEVEYSRYWHGYLLALKPLLFLTTFNTIRLLNSAVQLFLAGCVAIGFCKKKAYLPAKFFLLSLPFLFFVSTYASLSLSICYYVMTIALLIQLKYDECFDRKGIYGEFFLITGMAACYFDFLTYPVITLVYPLCVYLYFHGRTLGGNIRKMFDYSVRWFCGYIGLWAAKWLLTDLLTGSSTVRDALYNLVVRTGSAEGYSRLQGFAHVILENMKVYGNWCYAMLVVVILILLAVEMVRSRGRRKSFRQGVPYILLALYPFAWFFVTENHSEQHWQFTCRILAGSVFAILAGAAKVFGRVEDDTEEKDIAKKDTEEKL